MGDWGGAAPAAPPSKYVPEVVPLDQTVSEYVTADRPETSDARSLLVWKQLTPIPPIPPITPNPPLPTTPTAWAAFQLNLWGLLVRNSDVLSGTDVNKDWTYMQGQGQLGQGLDSQGPGQLATRT